MFGSKYNNIYVDENKFSPNQDTGYLSRNMIYSANDTL